MDRRQLLQTLALGVGSSACATSTAGRGGLLDGVPSLSGAEVDALLAGLEARYRQVLAPERPSAWGSGRPASVAARPGAEGVVRQSMASMLWVGAFRSLPEDVQVHPRVQRRIVEELPRLERSVEALHGSLFGLTPREQTEFTRHLRAQPDLVERVSAAVDDEARASAIGFSERTQLRGLFRQAGGRLRHSTPLFVAEVRKKVDQIQARTRDVTATERELIARMGEAAFREKRERLEHHARRWRLEGADVAVASGPAAPAHGEGAPEDRARVPAQEPGPAAAPAEERANRPWYETTKRTGLILSTVGLAVTGLGLLVAAGGGGLLGLYIATPGVIALAGGLVVLLVGQIGAWLDPDDGK